MSIDLLLVDNHDSFTYNLFQMLAELLGKAPVVIPNDAPWSQVEGLAYDAVVLSPGPGRPDVPRDFGLCRQLLETTRVPLLGVCLGHQGLAAAWGATVVPAQEVVHGRTSAIFHDGDALFSGLPSPFSAVRYHSLVVDELQAPLLRTAWTDDGVVMGIRHRDRPLWGVQFHPESICTENGARLLANFIELAQPDQHRTPLFSGVNLAAHTPPSVTATHEVHTRSVAESPEAEVVFSSLYGDRDDVFWLDSGCPSSEARFSFMGTGTQSIVHHVGASDESVFDRLRQGLKEHRVVDSDCPVPFVGGYVGFLGYEVKAECGGEQTHRAPTPDAVFLWVDRFIAFDHLSGQTYLVALTPMNAPGAAEAWFQDTENAIRRAVSPPSVPRQPTAALRLHRADRYRDDIAHCMTEIERGESYEVCLTTRLESEAIVDPFSFYLALRRQNAAPYAAFLRLGDISIASSSPERFLQVTADGSVEAKPIKGTRARGQTPGADRALAQDLATSVKDRAENLMITDLLRNDLGRTCVVGSVHVPALMQVESYATVHQLVSTIRGRLKPECDALECVRAAFPGGSMTGAPKLRTMEIIDTLEGEARGIYSGSLGYFGVDGAADSSIVIRTAVFAGDQIRIGVGGAIVALSDPEDEMAEVLLKGRALAEALGSSLPGDCCPSESAGCRSAEGDADWQGNDS